MRHLSEFSLIHYFEFLCILQSFQKNLFVTGSDADGGMVQNTQMTQMAQITQETQICSKCLKHADVGGADTDFLSACFRLSKTRRRLRGFILQILRIN